MTRKHNIFSLPLYLILGIIIILLILLLSKSTTTTYQMAMYDCKKEADNPEYITYDRNMYTFINECLGIVKRENPKRFVKYSDIFNQEVEDGWEILQARNECTRKWNLKDENFMKIPPSEKIMIPAKCERKVGHDCITLFGKCVFISP